MPILPKKRRRVRHSPSIVSGTYSEFVGSKPLPRAVRASKVLFLLGPAGVGKNMVARHIFGKGARHFSQQKLLEVMAMRILHRKWPVDLLQSKKLIIEVPCFLEQRPQILSLLQGLLTERFESGHRTIVLDAEDHGSIQKILTTIPAQQRSVILLRFPEGRGRYRFLAYQCRKRGLELRHARRLATLESWTYARVFAELDQLTPAEHQPIL